MYSPLTDTHTHPRPSLTRNFLSGNRAIETNLLRQFRVNVFGLGEKLKNLERGHTETERTSTLCYYTLPTLKDVFSVFSFIFTEYIYNVYAA